MTSDSFHFVCFSPLIPLATAVSDEHFSIDQLSLRCVAPVSLNDSLIHVPVKRKFPEHTYRNTDAVHPLDLRFYYHTLSEVSF